MSREEGTRAIGYEGPAELVWGSWIIEGRVKVDERSVESVPVGPREGISAIPDGPSDGGRVGAFVAHSDTEPMLLSTLATALGETYRLRWGEEEHRSELTVCVTALHGNRIHFETRG